MNEKEAVAPAFIRVQQPLPLLQQLVQFIINGFDVRADNDLTGVLPRTDDACCACRFYSLLIDLTVVLDLKAQAGSAVLALTISRRQLVLHLQWNRPMNCCFILRPQFGQICLLAPIAPPFNIEIQLARKLIQIKTCKAA